MRAAVPRPGGWRRAAVAIAACLLPAAAWSAAAGHPVHVSSTQVDLSRDGARLEVTVRMFTDDLEEALRLASGRSVRFGSTPPAVLDSLLRRWLAERVRIGVDATPAVPGTLLGHERDDDATLTYIEVPVRSVPRQLVVEQAVFLDQFADQTNLVHATIRGQKRSALLRRGHARELLEFGG